MHFFIDWELLIIHEGGRLKNIKEKSTLHFKKAEPSKLFFLIVMMHAYLRKNWSALFWRIVWCLFNTEISLKQILTYWQTPQKQLKNSNVYSQENALKISSVIQQPSWSREEGVKPSISEYHDTPDQFDTMSMNWCVTVKSLLANGSTAFIWKLCCHWLKGLW